jgi:hypothetical protein
MEPVRADCVQPWSLFDISRVRVFSSVSLVVVSFVFFHFCHQINAIQYNTIQYCTILQQGYVRHIQLNFA